MMRRLGVVRAVRATAFGLVCLAAGAAATTFRAQGPAVPAAQVNTQAPLQTAPAAWGQAVRRAGGPNPHLEIIHRSDRDRSFNMGYVPAIKITGGRILWLSGNTALPTYHDHPHRRDVIEKTLPNDLAGQTRATMESIAKTLEAAGAGFDDVVHMFIFRTRPRRGDMGVVSGVVDPYFGGHQPTSTNLAVLELGEPEQLIEIQMFAVVDE